jgi:hypothetical protein
VTTAGGLVCMHLAVAACTKAHALFCKDSTLQDAF